MSNKTAAIEQLPTEVEMKLPLHILTELEAKAKQFDPNAQFRLTGGCVRDLLLGRKPKDIDIITNTSAETLEMMGLENVGKAFPVYLYQDPQYGQIEIAVARTEVKNEQGGHKGFDVTPTGNFNDDMIRRDLNINAMMVDSEGKLYGPPEALQNINEKVLQNTSEKFAEDSLRVFRVCRFSSQFGADWKVSEQLTNMMRQMQPELSTLPADRVREETRKAMKGKAPLRFFEVLWEADCIDPWFSELTENWSGVVKSVRYGAGHGWSFEQQMIGIESQVGIPDSLNNRLGLSRQTQTAAHWIHRNRSKLNQAETLPKTEVVQFVQSGNRGVLSFAELLDCALLGSAPTAVQYLLNCAEAMKAADMTGVNSKDEATERLVGAIQKISAKLENTAGYVWHGTNRSNAQQIFKEGIRFTGNTWEEGELTPQYGRAYFGQSLFQAIGYSFDRDRENNPDSNNPNFVIYVFRVPKSELYDVTLDEDFVDALLEDHRRKQKDSWKPLPPINPSFDLGSWFNPQVADRFFESPVGQQFLQLAKDVRVLYPEDVKAFTEKLPDNVVNTIINTFSLSAVASDQTVWPDELYTITFKATPGEPIETHDISEEKLRELYNKATVKVQKVQKPKTAKTASPVQDAVDQAAEQIMQEQVKKPKPWETPQFKAWFGNSKVVNPDGTPKRVMHGTTHEFEEFKVVNPNEDDYYGPGFYFTDCPIDVSENYASLSGPDLRLKIELLAERMLDAELNSVGNLSREEEDELSDAVTKKAEEMSVGKHQGTVYITYLKMENPVIISQKGGTWLGGDSGFLNEEDEDEWVDGPEATKLYEAVTEVLGEPEDWLSDFFLEGGRAFELDMLVRSNGDRDNPGADLAEIYRLMGFDGVIMDANIFKNMKMTPGTKHYIVWSPRQIKSAIGNKGTWSPTNPLLTAKQAAPSAALELEDPVVKLVEEETPEAAEKGITPEEKDLTHSLADKRISPAAQSSVLKPGQIDPHSHATSQPDLDKLMQNEKFEQNVNLAVNHYPNFKYMREKRFQEYTAHQKAEEIINHMAANLIWLYKTWDKDLGDRAKLWYVGGNRIVHRWAEEFGLEPHKVAAILAALSPQAHWFQNVTTAERTLEALITMKDFRWDWKMDRVAIERDWAPKNLKKEMKQAIREGEKSEKKAAKKKEGEPEEPKQKWSTSVAIPLIRNKTLKQVLAENPRGSGREYLAAVWIRAWAEAHTPNQLREVTPEGAFGDTFHTGKKDALVRWNSFATISKAVMILESKSVADISRLIGTNHKVRSFYNNLIAPMADEGDITIDTHAVAAALLRPLAGSSVEVLHNFGSSTKPKADKNGKYWQYNEEDDTYDEITEEEARVPAVSNSSVTGLQGLYALYAEAYRRAAGDPAVGLLPRELQSITWEAVRALFSPVAKRDKKLKNLANMVWSAHDPTDGGKNADTARNEIFALIKGGFQTPTWYGTDHGLHDDAQHTSYQRELYQPVLPGSGPGKAPSTGAGGGTAPSAKGRGGIRSSLLYKEAALRFREEFRGNHRAEKYVTLYAYNGNFEVGSVDYTEFLGQPFITDLVAGNRIFTTLETKKLLSHRLKPLIDPKQYIAHELLKTIQRKYPDKDILQNRSEDKALEGLQIDETESEFAPLMREQKELEKEETELQAVVDKFYAEDMPETDKEMFEKACKRLEEVTDRQYVVEEALNVYPAPQLTKRIIRTSTLLRIFL